MKFKDLAISSRYKQIDFSNPASVKSASAYNMMLEDGKLCNRFGIATLDNPTIFTPYEFVGYTEFISTDCYVSVKGRTGRIAIAEESDDYSNIYEHIMVFFPDGSREDLGTITFTRSSPSTFFTPISYVFYSGTPSDNGGGIYMLCRLGCYDYPDEYRIYEISRDFTEWRVLQDTDFYTPTILINGRGENYKSALISNIPLKNPEKLEPMNMLFGKFNCYFTTDGCSNSFVLPCTTLGNEMIKCRFESSADNIIEWVINPNGTSSNTVTYNGVKISMYVNRNARKIFFVRESGEAYVLPFCNMDNNLFFTAYNGENSEISEICSMSLVDSVSGIVNSGTSSITVFSGGISPNRLVWINPENPLYFPNCCSLSLSEVGGKINKIFALGNRLFAVGKEKICSASIKSGEPFDLTSIISGIKNSGEVSFAKFSFNKEIDLFDCVIPKTIARFNETAFFCTHNGKIYSLESPLKITEIAQHTNDFSNNSFSAIHKGRYMIFELNSCLVYEKNQYDMFGLIKWEFPIEILSEFRANEDLLLCAKDNDGRIYTLSFYGDSDSYLESGYQKSKEIKSELQVTLYDDIPSCKFQALSVSGNFKKMAEITLKDDNKTLSVDHFCASRSRFLKSFKFINLNAKFRFYSKAEIFNLGIKYHLLKKM